MPPVVCGVEVGAFGTRIRPLAQLLCETAIVGHRPFSVGQAFGCHQLRHAGLRCRQIDVATSEQFGQRPTFQRSFWMEREVAVDDVDFESRLELFHTHGAEITPWSDVVRKDLKYHGSYFLEWFDPVRGLRYDSPACCRPVRNKTPGVFHLNVSNSPAALPADARMPLFFLALAGAGAGCQ